MFLSLSLSLTFVAVSRSAKVINPKLWKRTCVNNSLYVSIVVSICFWPIPFGATIVIFSHLTYWGGRQQGEKKAGHVRKTERERDKERERERERDKEDEERRYDIR